MEDAGGISRNMPTPDRRSLRLVVQHIWDSASERSSYRLVAYSNDHTYQPVQFGSLDELLKAFGSALPEFDVSSFPKAGQPVTSILFAGEMELTAGQLSLLGLRSSSGIQQFKGR
jgi:hypothetical protein